MTDLSLTAKQQFWFDHLKACAAAGQSMRDYAEHHGLDITAFYGWKAQLRRKGLIQPAGQARQPLFKKASVTGAARYRCRVVLPAGLALEFDVGSEPAWVAELVRALCR